MCISVNRQSRKKDLAVTQTRVFLPFRKKTSTPAASVWGRFCKRNTVISQLCAVTQSLNHSVTQPLSHLVTEPLSHLVTRPLNHSLSHSTTQPLSRSATQPLTQPLIHSATQPQIQFNSAASLRHKHQTLNNYSFIYISFFALLKYRHFETKLPAIYLTWAQFTINRKWSWLFVNGCKWRGLISTVMRFVNYCQTEINAWVGWVFGWETMIQQGDEEH